MLSGFRFDAGGQAVAMSLEEIWSLPRRPRAPVWIDIEGEIQTDFDVLSQVFDFHSLAIDDCRSVLHHPKIDEFDDHIFLIFRAIDFALNTGEVRTIKLACFLGENFLVTFHRDKMKSVDAVRERLPLDTRYGERGVDFIMHGILDVMVDLYFPELQEFEDEIDEIQDQVFSHATPAVLERILDVKRNLLHLRRFAAPQRDVLNRLSRPDYRYIRPANAIYFRDIFDHTYRISDAIDNDRDMIGSAMDTYLSVVSNRLNEIMKFLTMISTILLPLTFIAGIYGMNFEFMPELGWKYGYAFSLAIMAAVALVLLGFFKRKKWL